ncbi:MULTISPECIES: beta-lactamase regulator AmpE [Shewanella]|uniref:beta-lactamase regulator AmpE n=1 Tax=Shewanella TaxID=22 RepID=UPI001EFD456B|nr:MULTISPECIES: beta-lactamase regulator AmpE [Shewanella]MCG9748668.1 beta-lactamase regulator AmpE [Shewanella sp. Isolate8]MCL2909844.1 beta-lactamase regulator AmpE [Shewanella aquimarina]
MALFSLLLAIMIERLKLLPQAWQLETLLALYAKSFFGRKQLTNDLMMAIALILPAIAVQVLAWFVAGMFWGLLSLGLWVGVSILCFSHLKQRQVFKQYIQAACRGDAQACYHFADELDPYVSLDAVSEQDLGEKVGQTVAWLNYRFYGAVALYLIFFGPAGAVLYCTVRYFSDDAKSRGIDLPLVDTALLLLDWLPSRLIALGYVLSGHFSLAFARWRQQALCWRCPARDVISEVALAAETIEFNSPTPICVQSTISLLQLSKRNFILLVIGLSLLTIFGVVV